MDIIVYFFFVLVFHSQDKTGSLLVKRNDGVCRFNYPFSSELWALAVKEFVDFIIIFITIIIIIIIIIIAIIIIIIIIIITIIIIIRRDLFMVWKARIDYQKPH